MSKELEEAKLQVKEIISHKNDFDYAFGTKIQRPFTVSHEGLEAIETVLNYIENSIPKKVIEEKIEELYEEFNKLDKEIDEYLNDGNKNLAKCYENRERVAIMQTIGHIAGKFEELLEVE